jgi:hypothetical protein
MNTVLRNYNERKGNMRNHYQVDQFIAVSYLYFLMTDKSSTTVSEAELAELIIAINNDTEPFSNTGQQYLL